MSRIQTVAIMGICLAAMSGWAQEPLVADGKTSESGLSRFLNTSAPGLAGLEVQTDVDEAQAKRARAEEKNKELLEATQSADGAAAWRAKRERAAENAAVSPEEARRRKGIEEAFAADLQEKDENRIARNVHLWRVARLERILEVAKESGNATMSSRAQDLLDKETKRYDSAAKSGDQK